MIFVSKKDDGDDDIGEVGDKLVIEVCEPKERTDTLCYDRGAPYSIFSFLFGQLYYA